ncbi:MAG: ASKHA domain-containing protein [Acidobacteriota bacterium]
MIKHPVIFSPSGRSVQVDEKTTILKAAQIASEPMSAECTGRGACGRCVVRVLEGRVPDYRVLRRHDGSPEVLACQTCVTGPLNLMPLVEAQLPKLISHDRNVGVAPLREWAPWSLALDPIASVEDAEDLGVAIDIGTTTLRLVVVRLQDGVIVAEANAYNPQIPKGADVVSRIVAAEKGQLRELASLVRSRVAEMISDATSKARARPAVPLLDPARIRGYAVAGNLTMIHLLLEVDPSGIRRVPSEPVSLAFAPVEARELGWPGSSRAVVHTVPAVGGWVGGDIIAGIVRAGFSRMRDRLTFYVDLGTNGEIAVGGGDFALACACSAGPAFEGGGIRCGMRADRGAVDGARIEAEEGTMELSVIGGGRVRGVCGSGLIALTDALLRAGWIDRAARFTEAVPALYRFDGDWGRALSLATGGRVGLWERDLQSLLRAKAAIFAGIRSLTSTLGEGAVIDRIIVSGNFGRFLNLSAAVGIGLLPDAPLGLYQYVDNGSLEGAALALLSREFLAELQSYLQCVTYVNLSEVPGYMDEFVAASFLPHTDPAALRFPAPGR